MSKKLVEEDRDDPNKSLSELLEYARYVIEQSCSVTAEARELRAKLKLDGRRSGV